MTLDENKINQSTRHEDKSYKSEETALTITKPIPHIVNNEIEVKPEDVILSYADILNNPKNLTNANISRIEINFKSIDVKDDEKLLLKNSLEYLEFLKTSSLTTGDLFCIDFSKENILSKAWAPKKIAMETIIEASPRSENPPIEASIFTTKDPRGLEISVSPRYQTPSNPTLVRDVRGGGVTKHNGKNTIEPKEIIQSQQPEMKIFATQSENSLSMQTPVKAGDISDELSPYSQIKTPESLENTTETIVVASLGYVSHKDFNPAQQTPNPEITQRASSKKGASNSTGCSSVLRRLFK